MRKINAHFDQPFIVPISYICDTCKIEIQKSIQLLNHMKFTKPSISLRSIIFTLVFGMSYSSNAQVNLTDTISPYKWVELMLSPRPNYYQVKQAFDAQYKGVYPNRGTGYKSFKRWEMRVIQHLDDSGYVKWNNMQIQDFLNAHGSVIPSNQNPGFAPGNTTPPATYCSEWGRWLPVGPVVHPYNQTSQPTGIGRINGIAFHPTDSNTFFAMAPQGGVWKTKDFGKNWSHLWTAGTNNAFVTLGASSMALSYNNPDTLYIGTGDRDASDAPGYGVVFSSNGGNTFSLRNTGMGNVTVGKIRIHPKNSAILIAATNSGIFKSTNSGLNWTRTSTTANYTDVEFHPYNPSIVYAVTGGYFYKSTNTGSSFVQVTNGLPTSGVQRGEIAVTKADRGTVFMLTCVNSKFQGIYVSRDSATSFTKSNTTPANILGYSALGDDGSGQGWYDLDLAADPFNKNTLYAFGVNIWKSTDAGTTFTVCGHWVGSGGADDVHADQHAGEFSNSGRTIFSGNDGGIYFSRNGGKTWNNISSGIHNSQIYRISAAKNIPNMTAQGYQDNGSGMHQNDDFFTYWGGDGMDCAVDPTDEKYVFGSYVMGSIYRQYDRRLSRDVAANGVNGVNEGGGWLTPFVLQEGNPNRMFAGYVNVWRSDSVKTNGVIKFTKISTGFTGNVRNIKNSGGNKNILYVVRGDGKLFRSDNAGTAAVPTWNDLSATMPSGITLRAVETHPKDSNIVYIAGNSILYKSTNKGNSWTQIGNLGNASPTAGFSYGTITTLKYDSAGMYEDIYIGTDRGVYVYLNSSAGTAAGINEFSSGFPMWADVTDLDIYYFPKNRLKSTLFASTYGRGVWRSNLVDYGAFSSPKFKTNLYAFDSVFVVGGKVRLYEQIEGSVTSLKWQMTPSTFNWMNNDSTSEIVEAKFNAPGIYSVTLTANSCGTSSTLTKKHWIKVFAASVNPSCISTTTPSSVNYGMGISKVKLNDNFSETGLFFDDGQNLNLTKQKVFKIKANTPQTLRVTAGLGYPENTRIFIDYNNNGKFENWRGEVLSSQVANSANDAVFTFTPPSNLIKNQSILMRVMSDYNAVDTNACRNLGYGQSEDYSLVFEKITPNISVNAKTICTGQFVVYKDSSEGLINQWDWHFGAGAIPQSASGKGPHKVYYHSAGVKSVKLTVNGNISDTILKKDWIQVNQKPNAQVRYKSGNSEICEGTSFSLAVKDSFGLQISSKWYLIPSILKGSDTVFSVVNASLTDTGTYISIIQNKGCFDTSRYLTIQLNAKPKASFIVNKSQQCLNQQNFQFTNQSTIDFNEIKSSSWSVLGENLKSNTQDYTIKLPNHGTYNVKLVVISNKSCLDSVTKPIEVWPSPVARWNFVDSLQCDIGNSFMVNNTSSVAPNSTLFYTWTWADGTNETGASPKNHTFSTFGKYSNRMVVKTINNCSDTLNRVAVVLQTVKPTFNILNNKQLIQTNFCENEWFKVENTTSLSDSVEFGFTLNGKSMNFKTEQLSFLEFGLKTLTLKAIHLPEGCSDSSVQTVQILSNPVASFTANPNPLCAEQQSITTQNNSVNKDGKSMRYNWFIDNIFKDTSTKISHIFSTTGKHTIELIAFNEGCVDTFKLQNIDVVESVKADFTMEQFQTHGSPMKIQSLYTASDTLSPNYSYLWSIDGKKIEGKKILTNIHENGNREVKLIVKNSLGCADSSSQIQNIESYYLRKQNNSLNFNVFPNPTENEFAYSFSANAGQTVSVKMTTILGQQELYSKHWKINESGQYFERILLENLNISAGTYPLEIRCDDQVIWSKIIYLR